jgi:hypothetical protein
MTTALPHPRPRTIVLAMMLLGAAVMLVAASQQSARATHDTVTLTGTAAADDFLVMVDPADGSRLLMCAEVCFTRARSEVGTIVAVGLDGGDSLTVHHGAGPVTNTDGTLTVSFDAGNGLDTLQICTPSPGLAPCTTAMPTVVSPGATADERVVTQSVSATESLTITANDVAAIRDGSPGSVSVLGTAVGDQMDYRAAAADPATGEIAVGTLSPYRFTEKSSVSLDSTAGPDRISLATDAGIDHSAGDSCSPDGAPATTVCVAADGVEDDTLVVSSAGADDDQVALAARASAASTLTGLSAVPGADLAGIDRVELSVQSNGDTLTIATSPSADRIRAASTPSGVLLTGELATDATPYPLPVVDVTSLGTSPLRLTVNAGDGGDDDQLEVTGTGTDDTVRLGPTDTDPGNDIADTACTQALTGCLSLTPDGAPGFRATLRGVSHHLVLAGAGDDTLAIGGSHVPDTTWRGGDGADSVTFRGTGPAVGVDLATSSIEQFGAGVVVATGTERVSVDADGGSVATSGTPEADQLTFRPTAADSGRVSLVGHPILLELSGVGGTNVLVPAAGDDTVVVEGTTGADQFAVGRTSDPAGNVLTVGVDSLLPIRVSGAEAARLAGLGNDDEFNVTGTQGPATLTADGGTDTGADLVSFAVATGDATVRVDDDLGTGQLAAGGPPIELRGVERVDVEGDGSHGLTVRGSDGPDTLTQHGNTVTVGHTTDVSFRLFPDLVLAGGAASDQLWLAPASTNGVSGITAGGGTESDTLTVLGTPLSERVRYTPTAEDSGTVALPAAPPVTFGGIEEARLDGATTPPSGDTLVVSTPSHDGTLAVEPGSTFDSGTVRFLDVTGASTTAAPLHFGGLGRGEVVLDGDPAAPADRVVVAGQPDDDVVTVALRATGSDEEAVVTIDQRLPVAVPGAHTLVLEGLDGVDTFRIPTDHPLPGAAAPGLQVRAGGPDLGDRLELTGGGGPITADLAASTVGQTGHSAIQHAGVERIDLGAGLAPLTVAGGPGPDSIGWQPTGVTAGTVSAVGSPTLYATALGSVLLDPLTGADHVDVTLRSVADSATVLRGATTTVSTDDLQPVLVSPATESLTVRAGDGADLVRVVGSGGPASLAVDGGAPTSGGDELRLESADVSIDYATDPTAGRLGSPGGPVDFAGVEALDLRGDGSGALTVNGTDGAESIVTGETAFPRITVDGAAAVTHTAYPDVSLAGHGGNDDIVVGYRSLGDITRLTVDAGNGTNDRVTVADAVGTTRTLTVRPTTATTGQVTAAGIAATLTLLGTEALSLDGRSGDDTVQVVTPDGAQGVHVTPGSTADAGAVRVASLLPVDFHGVGAAGRLAVSDSAGGRVDALTLHGSAVSESIAVDGGTGEVRRSGWVPLLPAGALDLSVLGGDGADDVTVSGPVPYRTTTFDGGAPDLGDRLSVQGPVGAVEVDLSAASVTGYGGVILFPGVADLHTDVGGQSLTHVGTARDDALCYDPMAPRDGRLYIVGAPGGGTAASICLPDQRGTNVLHTFTDVAHLTADPAGGVDEVIVNGTTSRDLLTIHALAPLTEVTVHPEPSSGSTFRLPVHVVVATTESLVVAADNGSDSIDVTTYDSDAPVITVHGEGPATMRIGDVMVVRDGTGAAHLRDTNSHTQGSGTVTAEYTKGSGKVVRVDYTDVENVTLNRDPKSGD